MVSPEEQAAKVAQYVKWGMMGLGAVVIAPIAYAAAISVVEATIAIGAAIVVVGAVWAITPGLATWFSNKRLALLKAAAAEDPISTMDNLIMENTDELHQQEEQVVAVDTQWENVKKILAQLKKTDPDEAAAMGESEDLLHQASDELHSNYDQAAAALDQAKKARDKASRIWAASTAINKALAVAGAARSKAIQDLKRQVAFDAVTSNMSTAMARLRMTVQKHKNPPKEEPVVEGTVVQPLALPEAMPVINNLSQIKTKGKVNG